VSEREAFEPGVPCWVQAVHPDPAAAVAFYTSLLGWKAENLMSDDHPGDYFVCRLRGRDVAAIVSPHGAPAPSSAVWTTHVCTDSADATVRKVEEAGGRVIGEPFDSPGSGRMVVVSDPSGAVFCLWQPGGRSGAQLVNEPGAWAMSALITPDQESARRFYRTVFDWQTDTFGLGDAQVTLWRLPGYGGGEPQQPIPRDVVATMLPPDASGDAPPNWSVDFWVRDLDRTLATATDLGSSVLAGPYDIPDAGMRQAVIIDPQGATLSLTQPPGAQP
jgi:predicted enzyme related to lactoylglutathione lyase